MKKFCITLKNIFCTKIKRQKILYPLAYSPNDCKRHSLDHIKIRKL